MEFMPEIPPFTSDSGLFVPSTNLCAGDADVQRTGFDFTQKSSPFSATFQVCCSTKALMFGWFLIETWSRSPSFWGPSTCRVCPHSTWMPHRCRGSAWRSTAELLGHWLVEVALGEVPDLPTGLLWGWNGRGRCPGNRAVLHRWKMSLSYLLALSTPVRSLLWCFSLDRSIKNIKLNLK